MKYDKDNCDIIQEQSAVMPRRAFLLTLVRGLLAGSLLATVGALVTKHGHETCVANGICRDCGQLADCALPQAISVKAVLSHTR